MINATGTGVGLGGSGVSVLVGIGVDVSVGCGMLVADGGSKVGVEVGPEVEPPHPANIADTRITTTIHENRVRFITALLSGIVTCFMPDGDAW